MSKRFATAIQSTPRVARRIMYAALLQNCFCCVLMGKSNDAVSLAHIWCAGESSPCIFRTRTDTQRFVMHLRDGLLLRNLWFPRALSLCCRRLSRFFKFTVTGVFLNPVCEWFWSSYIRKSPPVSKMPGAKIKSLVMETDFYFKFEPVEMFSWAL